MEHESDDDTNYDCRTRNGPQKLGLRTLEEQEIGGRDEKLRTIAGLKSERIR